MIISTIVFIINAITFVLLLAKTRQRRSSEQPYFENCPEWSSGKREVERRARGRHHSDGRRAVCGCRRVIAFYKRTERVVFHRNGGTRRVLQVAAKHIIPSSLQLVLMFIIFSISIHLFFRSETNLKCRQCLAEVAELGHEVVDFDGYIRCEPPNNLLNKFHGTLQWDRKEYVTSE